MGAVTNRFRFKNIDAYITGKTLKVMLMAAGFTLNKDNNVVSEIQASASIGTNIKRKVLANVVVAQDDVNDRATLDADDPQWVDIDPTVDVDSAVIYVVDAQATDAVVSGSQGTRTVSVAGNRTQDYQDGQIVTWSGSTGNNGTYTVESATYDGTTNTNVVFEEAIPSATFDGNLVVDDADQCTVLGETDIADVDPAGNTLTVIFPNPLYYVN